MNKGIFIGGNILTDNVKFVELYPNKGMLATIESETLAVGGCVPNTAIDLKKLDRDLSVKVFGRIGADDKGEYVVSQMYKAGVDTSSVKISDKYPTSYSDVITVKDTGERTFFHNRGANAEFNPNDVDISKLDCDIFHIGYLMLLDYFDKIDESGITPMSLMLKKIQDKGIKTSIDIVSESSGNFTKVVSAALPYCNYVIINEIEACNIVGINARNSNGELVDDNIKLAMKKIMSYGVKEKTIIHCPEKAFCLNKDDKFTIVNSIKLKKNFIKGSVGAGDAFCAGALYAIYKEMSDENILSVGNLTAVNCLSQPDSISGVCSFNDLSKVLENN